MSVDSRLVQLARRQLRTDFNRLEARADHHRVAVCYLNRIQSSRRLERETQRNVGLMWLTERLVPDFKTIANFHKDNGQAIRRVCRQFVVLCQQLGLSAEALVTIDGSKFKAVNHRDRNFTSVKLQRRMEEIESSSTRYLTALAPADR